MRASGALPLALLHLKARMYGRRSPAPRRLSSVYKCVWRYPLEIHRLTLPQAEAAQGIAIVIDVLRAFSVAAYAFAGGARQLWLVREVEEAFALRKQAPEALLIGEVGGRKVPGFDLNNSPTLMARADVRDRLLIQRTGAGTQGAVRASQGASRVLICSLVNARATADYAARLASQENLPITLLPTARPPDSEDDLCADYLAALLREQVDAEEVLREGIARLDSHIWREFRDGGSEPDPDFPADDVRHVLDANRFDFALQGTRRTLAGVTFVDVSRVSQ